MVLSYSMKRCSSHPPYLSSSHKTRTRFQLIAGRLTSLSVPLSAELTDSPLSSASRRSKFPFHLSWLLSTYFPCHVLLLKLRHRHGKDNKIVVWKFSEEDENELSKILPVDTAPELRKQPWVLHILNVNTMNFCSFAQCSSSPDPTPEQAEEELLIAVPNTLSSETVSHLPFTDYL